jgi:DNA polymerase III, delta subunit
MQGNTHIRWILDWYTDTILQTGVIPVPFVLLIWPTWLGKYQYACDLWKKIAGEFANQDIVTLRDCSRDLWKDHTIKVSSDDEIELLDWSIYVDLGIREVNQRVVKAPAGKRKILIIENAERMNEASSNALLKMLEEPLPWRMIIATCSRANQILPTILSRALICSFYPTDDKTVLSYISQYPELASYDPQRLIAIASWRPWILDQLRTQPESLDKLQQTFIILQDKKVWISHLYKQLVILSKAGLEKIFLQAYIFWLASHWLRNQVQYTQDAFAMTNYTLNTEHILFDFVTAHYAATHT